MNGTLRSKQRPDTLVQDRIYWIAEIFLHRAAGPHSWVIATDTGTSDRVTLTASR
jgi:hypothetical protein